jgi:hypothetical protein
MKATSDLLPTNAYKAVTVREKCNHIKGSRRSSKPQPGGAGTKGSLSSPPGWDAVISGLRPERHVLRAENLRVKWRFRRVVLQRAQRAQRKLNCLSPCSLRLSTSRLKSFGMDRWSVLVRRAACGVRRAACGVRRKQFLVIIAQRSAPRSRC